MTHTPAPWKSDGQGWIENAKGETVVEYEGCGTHGAEWPNPADFNLVLAAPELLEALELADAALSGAHMDMKLLARKCKAAIAKARGEQA